MPTSINVTIESSARFRPGSTASDQKELDQYQAYRVLLAQVLKVMVMIASLVGVGVAIGWFFGLFGETDTVNHNQTDQALVPQQHAFPSIPLQQSNFLIEQAQPEEVDRQAVQQDIQSPLSAVAMLQIGSLVTGSVNGQEITLNAAGTLAFVADGSEGLKIIDVSNPSSPALRGSLVDGNANGVALNTEETLAFVADPSQGLKIIDVSNTNSPTLKWQLLVSSLVTGGNALGVVLNAAGTLAFVADGFQGLKIIDVGNASSPVLRGSLVTGGLAQGVALNTAGTLAFVADGGLNIIDVSNPSNPVLRGSLVSGSAFGVALNAAGTLAFVADSFQGLKIIDVSNPSSPVLRGSLVTGGTAQGITLNTAGTLAFVADTTQGLKIIDVSNASSPVLRGSLVTGGLAQGVALNTAGTLAFVVDTAGGEGLKIIDVSDPSSPALRGSLGTGGANGVALNAAGTLAFVAGDGLNIIDVSNPSLVIAAYNIRLNTAGTLAFVVGGASGLHIIDVSNASGPVSRGSLGTGGNAFGVALNTAGTLAFVLDSQGLNIIDVSNPSSPVLRGSLATGWAAKGVTLNAAGTLAFMAYSSNQGLKVIDVSNPSSPVLRGSWVGGNAFGVALNTAGTLAFVADFQGLSIIDVSNPSNPVLRGTLAMDENYGVTLNAAGTLAFVVGSQGLNIILVSYSLSSSLPNLMVGENLEGRILDGIPIDHTIKNVYSINSNGNRDSLPYWFSIARTGYNGSLIFSGMPTKDYSGTDLVLEIQVLSPGATLSDALNYPRISLPIKPSLIINTSSPKLSIQSPGTLGSLLIQLSNPESGRFVNQVFGGVSFLFDPTSGTGNGVGTIKGFNDMFQALQFSVDDPSVIDTTSVTVKVDDTVNQPQTASGIPLSKFTLHQHPTLNPGILSNQSTSALNLFDFIIPENTFSPNPSSLPLTYNVTERPSWLTYNPITRRISGTLLDLNMLGHVFEMIVSANDGYKTASTPWRLSIYLNQPPTIGVALNDTTATANQPFIYPIANGFNSSNPLHYSYSANRAVSSSSSSLYPWLRLDSTQGILSGQPTDANLGNYPVIIIASDSYGGSANQTFSIRVIDPSAASAERLAQLQEILKIVGYAATAAGTAFTLYKNKALIRNTWVGKSYTRPANVFDENGTYQVAIPSEKVKEIKVMERTKPQTCRKKTAAVLANCMSHHLYGQVTFVQRSYEDWVNYDRRTNTLQLDVEKLPEMGEWGIQILDNDGYVLEEVVLDFPLGREADSEDVNSEELEVSRRSLGVGDRALPREGMEVGLLAHGT